jgi:hypothetical protein
MLSAVHNPLLLRRVGFALFAVSFFTPAWRFEGIGFQAFLSVPYWVLSTVFDRYAFYDWRTVVSIVSLSLGWLSNFTVFFSLPSFAAAIAITAPWLLFFAVIFASNSNGPDTHWLSFIPFYLWAFGILIIHWSRLMERRRLMTVAPTLAKA